MLNNLLFKGLLEGWIREKPLPLKYWVSKNVSSIYWTVAEYGEYTGKVVYINRQGKVFRSSRSLLGLAKSVARGDNTLANKPRF
jgi:hypothetical protein